MRKSLLPLLLTFALLATGCFQTRVATEKEPSNQVIERAWVGGFINGLVMTSAANVDAAQRCENGVAMVETVHTFPNMLVTGITFGLYSPMKITVTCAAGSSMSGLMDAPEVTLPNDATDTEMQHAISNAAHKSAKTEEPVRIQVLD